MKQKGFTFIEIVVAILIIGIFSTCLGMGMKLVEQAKFKGTVCEVVNNLEYVKNAAACTGRQYNCYCFDNRILFRTNMDCLEKVYLSEHMSIPGDCSGKEIYFNGTIAPRRAGTIIIKDDLLEMQARSGDSEE